MKATHIVVSIIFVYVASGVPLAEDGIRGKAYPRFIEFPDGAGNMHTVDLEGKPDMTVLNEVLRNPANNAYILFTRRNANNGQTLVFNNADSILNSNFNPNVPTKVIIHGWLSNQNTEPNPTVRRVYLNKSDVNIITVDWRSLAASDYVTAVLGVPAIGRGVGEFLRFLNQSTGARFDQMHLIGYSLGAHAVGNAGRELGGQVARVTGLDPAGPLWPSNSNRLSPTDGVYVEAIHTDGGVLGLGIGSAIARADFFPNGGNSQPGCSTSLCNHDRAWELFAASITYNHLVGRECTNTLQIVTNSCTGQELRLGNDDLRKWGSGMYRVNTGPTYPFSSIF